MMHRQDPELAAWFVDAMAGKGEFAFDDPPAALARRIHRIRIESTGRTVKTWVIVALWAKAWNLTVEGKKVKVLTFRRSGPGAENMPEFQKVDW